jgi:hypothetical protein
MHIVLSPPAFYARKASHLPHHHSVPSQMLPHYGNELELNLNISPPSGRYGKHDSTSYLSSLMYEAVLQMMRL